MGLKPFTDFTVFFCGQEEGRPHDVKRTSDPMMDTVTDADFILGHDLFSRMRGHLDLRLLWTAIRLICRP